MRAALFFLCLTLSGCTREGPLWELEGGDLNPWWWGRALDEPGRRCLQR